MLGMAFYFIWQEHIEVFQIKEQLAQSHPGYIMLGIALTVVYIIVYGQMYVHSFRAVNQEIPLGVATRLFLKRNLISILLPAGGFSSLAFFNKELESRGTTKSQIYLASTLYGFVSVLSVVVVAIPILGIALLSIHFGQVEILGFVFLILMTGAFIFLIYSVAEKGLAYRWLSRMRPSMKKVLDDMVHQDIRRGQFGMTLLVSIGLEFIGVIHLYISMLALGLPASWPAAIIGYVVMVIILIASPFLRGLGLIEISLAFILVQFGFPKIAAATITLLFRFFEFWLPLLAGLGSFITRKDNIILRILPAFIILILGIVNIISAITPATLNNLTLP